MWTRVYATVGRPSVCLSPPDCRMTLQQIGCSGPGDQEILINCCTAGGPAVSSSRGGRGRMRAVPLCRWIWGYICRGYGDPHEDHHDYGYRVGMGIEIPSPRQPCHFVSWRRNLNTDLFCSSKYNRVGAENVIVTESIVIYTTLFHQHMW